MNETLTRRISGWLDETSDPGRPSWVVSRDEIDDGGGARTTRTLKTYRVDEHKSARRLAVEEGERVAEKEQLRLVVESPPQA